MSRHTQLAQGVATALLAGPWTRREMNTRVAAALKRSPRARVIGDLTDAVLTLYRDAPRDRPRELANVLLVLPNFIKLSHWLVQPHVRRWQPATTEVVTSPWAVTPLPDLGALAGLLDLTAGELDWFADLHGWERSAAEPLRHYRWREVPKRGGTRLVAAPKPRLKEIQRRLLRHVLTPIPLHSSAHGGVQQRSVRTAVLPHSGAAVVIRADLTDFFGSISAARIWGVLRLAGLPETVALSAAGLMTTVVPRGLRPTVGAPLLPTGAPTSPAAANLVAFNLDRRLSRLAVAFGASYTRYVDDLTFSGGPSLRNARSRFVALLEEIVRDEGFRLNERKTVVLGHAGRQQVLGAVVNTRPTLPRVERDALRATLHNCAVHGWRTQIRGQADFPAYLRGRIAWVTSLDPVFGATLLQRYHDIDWS